MLYNVAPPAPKQNAMVTGMPQPASGLPIPGSVVIPMPEDTLIGPPIDWATMPIMEQQNIDAAMVGRAILDNTRDDLAFDSFDADLFRGGLSGLGALGAKKKAVPASPGKVTVPVPQPIKQSTMYLIVGGAAVMVMGAVALWAWSKSGKK
jgi:hypothetical protein